MSGLVYNPGPYCPEHRSEQCHHALEAVTALADVPHIAEFLESATLGTRFTTYIPLWPERHMWETIQYKVAEHSVFGRLAEAKPLSHDSNFHSAIRQLMPGDGIYSLMRVLRQQHEDLLELEWPGPRPGVIEISCRSGTHSFKYQTLIEKEIQAAPSGTVPKALEPHLFGIRARAMCAYCWADAYGTEARRVDPTRVASNAWPEDEAVDFADLLPDASMGMRGRPRSSHHATSRATDIDLPF